jgi:cytochrome c-type biogenesis protein CcmH
VRRLLLVVAGMAVVAVAVLSVATWLQPAAARSPAERSLALARQMRCPDCQALSVAESHTNAAAAIRAEIERQVASGRSDEEIRRHFTEQYGEWILLAPPEPLVWWLPVAGVVVGVLALAAWYGVGRAASTRVAPAAPADVAPLGAADRQRINDELEALDG